MKPLPLPEVEDPHLDPPLKWAGGKRWLVPRLLKLFEPYRALRLVEPFAGGLSVSLHLNPERALLGDRNEHAINFYKWLRRGLTSQMQMKNDKLFFYRMRKRFNDMVDRGNAGTEEAAVLFYYLNRTCYNGLCRFNSSGFFNVPFGRYKTINYRRTFLEYQRPLKNWKFVHGDFQSLALCADDFIYADPPYDVEFTRYSKDDFTWNDQIRLVEWLLRHGGPVVASNQATTRILELYRNAGFAVELVDAPRMISCTGDRTRASEMLAMRNLSI